MEYQADLEVIFASIKDPSERRDFMERVEVIKHTPEYKEAMERAAARNQQRDKEERELDGKFKVK